MMSLSKELGRGEFTLTILGDYSNHGASSMI